MGGGCVWFPAVALRLLGFLSELLVFLLDVLLPSSDVAEGILVGRWVRKEVSVIRGRMRCLTWSANASCLILFCASTEDLSPFIVAP